MKAVPADLEHPTRSVPGKEINLKESFGVVKKRFWMIIVLTIVFTLIGAFYSSRPLTPFYDATIRLIVTADSPEFLNTLKVFSREPVVMNKVIKKLDLRRSPGALRNQVMITSLDASMITLITAVDPNPKLAVEIANTTARVFTDLVAEKFNFKGIEILTEAEVSPNPTPINPKSNRAIYIGLFMGIALGIVLTFLLDSLDDSIKSVRDIERVLGVPVLGHVSKFRKKDFSGKNKRKKKAQIRSETIGL